MQCNSHREIAKLSYSVLQCFQVDQYEAPAWERLVLLIGTAIAETGLMRNVARSGGLGLWNVGLENAMEVFFGQLYYRFWEARSRRDPWRLFMKSWLGISSPKFFIPTKREMRYLLVNDDRFACSMATWFYLGGLDSLEDNLPAIADHWHAFYPSIHNKRPATDFLDAWSERDGNALMLNLGYR